MTGDGGQLRRRASNNRGAGLGHLAWLEAWVCVGHKLVGSGFLATMGLRVLTAQLA